MAKVVVAYWSGTGNTERMAEIIGNGVKAAGKEAEVVSMDAISAADLWLRWKALLLEKLLVYLAPTAGATDSG